MRNEAKLKNWGLAVEGKDGKIRYPQVKFYYLKFGVDELGRATKGIATVCVMPISDGIFYVRGISFCSPQDQFVKKVGRAIALGRAIEACEHRASSERIPDGLSALLVLDGYLWSHFSTWNAGLTDREKLLFQETKPEAK